MNPAVDQAIIDEAYDRDESAALAEYGAQFRRDIEAFIAREVLEACVMRDRHELPPMGQTRYVAFTDPSGGSVDAWTLAVGHGERRDKEWIAVLDVIREVRPPFSPTAVAESYAMLLKQYRVTVVHGDKYGGEFPRELFAKHGITYQPSERTKSEIYVETLPLLNAHRIELLDHRRLAAELVGLERRTARGGRDSVDHSPRAHDDLANAAAGALLLASDGPSDAMPAVTRSKDATNWSELTRLDRVDTSPGSVLREFGPDGFGPND